MDPVIFFAVLFTIYGVVLFFDLFFKSCMHYPYEAFLHNTGLKVQFLRIKWHTTALNRTIFRWGSSCSKILIQSFNIGVLVTVIMLPIGICILLLSLFGGGSSSNNRVSNTQLSQTNILSASNSNSGTTAGTVTTNGGSLIDAKIEIFLPGFNLPLEEIFFYILTLMICSVVHELGHGLSAVLEDVPLTGFGVRIYFCLPVAYTEMSTEHLNSLKGIRKMRVLCAGIWHNIILAGICYLLFSTLGIFLSPFYKLNESVIITDISKNSPLLGEKGLYVNDMITKINDCHVYNVDTWHSCLTRTITQKSSYCVTSDFIRLNDESHPITHGLDGIIQCCDPLNIKVSCFEHINDDDLVINNNPIEIPQYICLDIRKTIEDSFSFCNKNQYKCDNDDYFCIKPLLNNLTTIMTLYRKDKLNVIYIGHPSDLLKTIKISQYVPKLLDSYKLFKSIFTTNLADSIELFLKYNIVFSFGLALINLIPCFGFDGHHIISTIINNYLVIKITEKGKRDLLILLISSLGTLLLFSSVIKILLISIFNNKIF